ncbi:MAG: PD40 domain-containing protein [Sandaracinaceae bacterium]|nr:PD40 domain-containing protein [Sandaracinaceae bacterium]
MRLNSALLPWLAMCICMVWGCGRFGFEELPIAPDAAVSLDASEESDAATEAGIDAGLDAAVVADGPLDAESPDAADSGVAPAVAVTPTSGLVTTEAGGSATISLSLTTAPTSNVTVSVVSSALDEATALPATVTFTPLDWAASHVVTVTGVDDAMVDGDQPFTVQTSDCVSLDTAYSGLTVADAMGVNIDDESAGVVLSRTTGLSTTENGGTATFSVALRSAPSASVVVTLSSSDETEVLVAPTPITFTTLDWAAPQMITATGVDDAIADGDQPFAINLSAASTDTDYSGIAIDEVTGLNIDDETPGIVVTPSSGLTTSESGASTSFTVVLQSQPTASVMVPLDNSDSGEGALSDAVVTFTTDNWNVPQSVTVTGQDDLVADGDQMYTIGVGPALSTDPRYAGLSGDAVDLTNLDNEGAGFTLSSLAGLTTTEAGGNASFTIVLDRAPIASVLFTISSTDTTEGTVTPSSMSFTPGNWNVPQTVVVSAVDDPVADGDQPYNVQVHLAASGDSGYAGLADQFVAVTNIDDDTADIIVTPTAGLTTTETGGTAVFTVVLTAQPSANVTINLVSSVPTEGMAAPASLLFTSATWNVPRTVTVTGADDLVADGARAYTIITSVVTADPSYSGINPADVSVTNTDNDAVGVTVSPTAGLTTSESGTSAAFFLHLNSQPSADVTITFTSDDLSEGTVSPASVTFSTANWNVARVVTIVGVNDAIVDGSVAFNIVTGAASSADMAYSGFAVADVTVVNTDNDSNAVVVTPTSGLVTTEGLGTATFSIVLSSMPSTDVTISVSSSDLTEGTVSPATVTLTSSDWNSPHVVTVTGVNDILLDGSVAYTIVTGASMSADGAYNGLVVADVFVTNTDNEVAGISVSPVGGLVTSEGGATAAFNIVLTSPPTADVTVPLYSSDESEGVPNVTSLTFTSMNWNAQQTVTITGRDDAIIDGTVPYTIVLSAATSTDPSYTGRDALDVAVSNTDNEGVAGVVIVPSGPRVTTENRSVQTFTLRLNSNNTSAVTVNLTSTDTTEGVVSPSSILFGTPGSYLQAVPFTVTGVDDLIIDGDRPYSINVSVVSADSNYNGLSVTPLSLTNTDNDVAPVITSPGAGLVVTEGGTTATAQLVLSRAPSANVTIGLASSDTGEATIAPASMVFTTANWATPQLATLTGVADGTLDGDQAVSIVTAPAVSGDVTFSGSDALDIGATVIDVQSQRCVSCTTALYTPIAADRQSVRDGVSLDGRYALFTTTTAVLPADTNGGVSDVYLRDRQTNTLELISVSSAGVVGNGPSSRNWMSSDGRFIAFESGAANLVASDTNGANDIFLRDRMAGTTRRVSLSDTGAELGASFIFAAVSDDGRYVAFLSLAPAVSGDTNSAYDVFVRDMTLNTTTRASVTNTGAQFTLNSVRFDMSADGRYVVFGCFGIYVRDLLMGTTTTVASYGDMPAISRDGRYIVYSSTSTTFVPNDINGVEDIFLYDSNTMITSRVSVGLGGTNANAESRQPTVSDDGNRIAFRSLASNLVADDTNEIPDAFVYDRSLGQTFLVTRSPTGVPQDAADAIHYGLEAPSISGDGHWVLYATYATNIMYSVWDPDRQQTSYLLYVP